MTKLTRRQFLKLTGAAAAGTALAGAGCMPQPAPTATPRPAEPATALPPTLAPTAMAMPAPTATAAPTVTAVAQAGGRPELIKFFPDATSRVVQTHHAGVWKEKQLSPEVVRQMLDSSITKLTGLSDAKQAWAALFRPTEKIAIKVNAFGNSTIWTHAPLVKAVTDSLQEAGIPAEQIVIFDAQTSELKTAGYAVNLDGPGVRCHGTDGKATGGFTANGNSLKLSNILMESDALINMPVLKSHMIAGFTFAMKNHYGSVTGPEGLHPGIGRTMAELNRLPPIKDKTRLIVGDVLEANLNFKGSWPYWEADYTGDSILMSYDTLAHDVVGLNLLTQLKKDNTAAMMGMATPCIKGGVETGLGAGDLAQIEFVETKLA